MAEIIGVRRKRIGKRDGKTYFEVYWTPYRGANKVFKWVKANTALEASYKRRDLMAQNQSNASCSDGFSELRAKLIDSIKRDTKNKKTISQYINTIDRLFEEYRHNDRTYNFRKEKFPNIKDPQELTPKYIEEYCNWYSRFSNLRSELIRVKSISTRLYRLEVISRELLDRIRGIPTPEGKEKPYMEISDTKIEELSTHIKKDRPDYYKPIYFMFKTGRRRGEVCLYEKEDVIREGFKPVSLSIRAEITKTQTAGKIHFDKDLSKLIHAALVKNNTKWLFPNRKGRKCNPDKVCQYLKATSKKVIGIEITPHYFRKRFHTKSSGLDMKDRMAISGLRDPKVLLKHYEFSTPEGQAKVLEKIK